MNTRPYQLKLLWLFIVLMSFIFMIEMYSAAWVGTVAYIFVILCFLWFSKTSQYLMMLGVIASLFHLTSFILLFHQVEGQISIVVNRTLSLSVIWLAIYFCHRFRRLYDEQRTKTNQLNALFENAHEGILYADGQGQIIMANPFLESMLGYATGELAQKNVSELIPEKLSPGHVHHLNSFFGHPHHRHKGHNLSAKCKDGRELSVEISLSHYYSGKQLIAIVFIVDSTDKIKHQELQEAYLCSVKNYNLELEEKVWQRTHELVQMNLQLRKSQSLYKAMASNFPDGIIGVLDRSMKYLLVGGKDLRPLGLDEEKITEDKTFDDLHAAMVRHAEGLLVKVYSGESISFDVEVRKKIYNISAVPLCGHHDEINEILVVFKNITAQKKLEQDLLKTLEKEKELNLLKSRFVTLASHEFRSPLTTIQSSAFLLEHYSAKQLETEKSKHLNRITRAVQGLTELLNDFLSLGKLEEGKVKVVLTPINLRQYMEELLQEVDLQKKAGQTFALRLDSEVETFLTDKQLFRNILMNLVSNAIKYTPEGGNIELEVRVVTNRLLIQITDHGIGIPPDEHKHIFKRFFRAKNAADIQGTGLGLNLVQRYVKLLKGTIRFTSIPNIGTTFTIKLPLHVNVPQHYPKNQAIISLP